MKQKLLIILITLISIVFIFAGCAPSCPEMGDSAPDFTLETVGGERISLSDFYGKTVIINFWATWCGPCVFEMPHLQAIYDESSDKTALLSINTGESAATVKDFVTNQELTFPVLIDQQAKVAQQYCLPQALPQTLFIDVKGVIKAKKMGAFRNPGEIKSMLESL